MPSRTLETLVGFFFMLGVAALFILTFRVASLDTGGGDGYAVTARFENIGGLRPGAAVTVAGVRVGRVREITIDPSKFDAKAVLEIERAYDTIPKDSSAKILTAGLLGEQYIGLEPGGDEVALKDGDTITLTQSALVLENLIGQFVAGKAEESANK